MTKYEIDGDHVIDDEDSCNPREFGDQCGGCGRCLLRQAEHAGCKVVQVGPIRAKTYEPVARGVCPGCDRIRDLRFVFGWQHDDSLFCVDCGADIDEKNAEHV